MHDIISERWQKWFKATPLLTHLPQKREIAFPNTLCRHTPAKSTLTVKINKAHDIMEQLGPRSVQSLVYNSAVTDQLIRLVETKDELKEILLYD